MTQIISGGTTDPLSTTNNVREFNYVYGCTTWTTTEQDTQGIVSSGGKIKGLAIKLSQAPGDAKTWTTFVVKTDTGNTAITAVVTGASGGVNLISAAVVSVLLKAVASCSSDIYVGDVTSKPFSGIGFALSPGEAVNMDINQVGTVWVCAANSGDKVTWLGVL